ncbi:hypothetical protein [uncultured Pseudokineococcus sp.]|uniref:hypothetical protein n=1 Tax=uncultured Pseudokineococcus sp. TaxID=1642928 RepID=UPI00260198CF|nr:hypothetical protein [uncultured Pseudokineococcus sp.]
MTRYNGSRHLVGVSGLVSGVERDILHPDKLIKFSLSSGHDARFVNHQLASANARAHIEPLIRTTAGQSGISGPSLRSTPLVLPPLDEQRRIVAVLEDHLSRLDAADAYLASAHARAEAMRLSTVQRLLAGAPSAATALEDLLDVSIGGVWGSAPGEEAVDVAVLRVTELRPGGRLDERTAARRSVSPGQLASRRLQVGDLLLEKSGGGPKQPIGRVGLVEAVTQDSVCANFMQLMRPDPRCALPRFLHLYLNHLHSRGDTLSMQKASTNIRNIKASEYVRLPVPLPSLGDQHRIVAQAAAVDAEAEGLKEAVAVATRRGRALRRAFLTAAFTGRLTGRSSDMDVAEELAEAAS